jgi:hypothetical protein
VKQRPLGNFRRLDDPVRRSQIVPFGRELFQSRIDDRVSFFFFEVNKVFVYVNHTFINELTTLVCFYSLSQPTSVVNYLF